MANLVKNFPLAKITRYTVFLSIVLSQVKWKNIHFIMWDIGGQESLRQAWSTYFTGSHFLILVVDSTDRERLSVAKEELYRMLGHEVRE